MSIAEQRNYLSSKNALYNYNYLCTGHKAGQCQFFHWYQRCQRPHHTLLHQDQDKLSRNTVFPTTADTLSPPIEHQQVVSNTAIALKTSSMLMTCKIVMTSPNGNCIEIRALLDPGSIVTERITGLLQLPKSKQTISISGIAASSAGSPIQTVTNCKIFLIYGNGKPMDIAVIVLPQITREMPAHRVQVYPSWSYLKEINLADPTFCEPGKIDEVLGIEVYVEKNLPRTQSRTSWVANCTRNQF